MVPASRWPRRLPTASTLEGKTVFGSNLARTAGPRRGAGRLPGQGGLPLGPEAGKFEFTPYLGDGAPIWPLVADGSAANRDLRLGGSTYDKGSACTAAAA